MRRRGVAPSAETAELEVASRTDRGVGARANVLALSSDLTGPSLLRRLNAVSPELWFTAATPVRPEFRVRVASRRTYRYYEPGEALRASSWQDAAALFHGPVDVRSFGRGVRSSGAAWRTVESVSTERRDGGRVIEVRAPSFVWGMVRKIVGALREVDAGRLPLARLRAAVAGRDRLTLPLAEADGLVLWAVEYPELRWESVWSGPNRHQSRYLATVRSRLWQRRAAVEAMDARAADGA